MVIELDKLDELSILTEERNAVEPFYRDRFSRIRIKDFNYQTNFKQEDVDTLAEYDIVIHKKFMQDSYSRSGKMLPPTVIYYIFLDGELLRMPYASKSPKETTIKSIVKNEMIKYIIENKQLPYATKVFDITLGKKIILHYNPTEYDKIPIDIEPLTDINIDNSEDKVVEFFRKINSIDDNEFQKGVKGKVTKSIDKIKDPRLNALTGFSDNTKIEIVSCVIKDLELRKDMYMEHETFYYIARVVDVKCKTDFNPFITDIDEANIRFSTNVFDKYNLRKGDKISCNGKIKNTSRKGIVIQNVKAINIISRQLVDETKELIEKYNIEVSSNFYNVPLYYFDIKDIEIDVFLIINIERLKEMKVDVKFTQGNNSETLTHILHFKTQKSLLDALKYVPFIIEIYNNSNIADSVKNFTYSENDKTFKIIKKILFEPVDNILELD